MAVNLQPIYNELQRREIPVSPEDEKRRRALAKIMASLGGGRSGNYGQSSSVAANAFAAAGDMFGGYMAGKAARDEASAEEAERSALVEAIRGFGSGEDISGSEGADVATGYAGPDTLDAGGDVSGDGSYDIPTATAYIRDAAAARGIDPDVAVRVARSEGLGPGVWQSNVVKDGKRETSYGPFQLLVGGGLGDKFQEVYGKSPSDRSTWREQIDFALDEAAKGGWSPWYGAAKVGVGRRTGLDNARALGPQPSYPQVSNMGAGRERVAAAMAPGQRVAQGFDAAPGGGISIQPPGAPGLPQFDQAAAAMGNAPAPVAPQAPVAPAAPQQSAVGTHAPAVQRIAQALTPGQTQAFQPEERGSALAPALRPAPTQPGMGGTPPEGGGMAAPRTGPIGRIVSALTGGGGGQQPAMAQGAPAGLPAAPGGAPVPAGGGAFDPAMLSRMPTTALVQMYKELSMDEYKRGTPEGQLAHRAAEAELQRRQLDIQEKQRAAQGFQPVSEEEARAAGLGSLWDAGKRFQRGPDGKLSEVGGGGVSVTTNVGDEAGTAFEKEFGKQGASQFFERRQGALDAVQSLTASQEARDLLKSGVITGFGADWVTSFGSALQRLGFNEGDAVANTQAFVATRAQEVGRIIKLFGAGTGLSDADRQFATKAAAGDITLNEQAIKRILDINERASRNVIDLYNKDASQIDPSLSPFDLTVEAPAEYAPPTDGEVPEGVDPEDWKHLTPEERKLWQQ